MPVPSTSDDTRQIAIKAMNAAIEKINQEPTSDEFRIFGNFIACELRKIPDINNARRIQRKMQRVMLDEMDAQPQQVINYVDEMGNPINSNIVQRILSQDQNETDLTLG